MSGSFTEDFTAGIGSGSSSGGGGTTINQYTNVSAFPSTAGSGELAIAIAAEGTWLVNRKPAGLYRWSGTAWVRLGDINNALSTAIANRRHKIINADSNYVEKQRPNGTKYILRLLPRASATGVWADRATLTYTTI